MKRFIALVLSLVMALSLCAPAWGAEGENAIADAIAAGETEITLGEGTYTLPNINGKNITLIGAGTEKTTVDYSHMGGYQEVSGSSFLFKNMTIKCAETGYPYPGLQHTTGVSYENCHILGTVNLFCPATFKNCTFDSLSAEHNAVTYGSDSVTFEDCEFTYADRSINCYAEDASSRDIAVTFINCEFTKVAGKDVTGAIETNSSFMKSLTLTITDCTVNEGDLWWVSTWDSKQGANTAATVNYTVTFNSNFGNSISYDYVVSAGSTLPEFSFDVPDGYTFKGWATSADATEVLDTTYTVTAPVTLYAIWEAESSAPVVPPVEGVVVTAPEEIDTVVNNTVIEAVKDEAAKESSTNTVTVSTPVEGNANAETTIEFADAEAKSDFASATDITTQLTATVEDVTTDVKNAANGDEIAVYLDIDITVLADGEPVGEITQLPKPIKVVIPASALTFGELEAGYTRNIYVIRFHEGVATKIPAKLEANGDVSFESHLFSTYAVVYEDVKTPTGYYPAYPSTDKDVTSPETFDAGIALYVGVSVMGAMGAVVLGKKRED